MFVAAGLHLIHSPYARKCPPQRLLRATSKDRETGGVSSGAVRLGSKDRALIAGLDEARPPDCCASASAAGTVDSVAVCSVPDMRLLLVAADVARRDQRGVRFRLLDARIMEGRLADTTFSTIPSSAT